ncbi:TetR/AcrR family transcriptional regulator [Verrucomicrobium sp. BvORR106]|uniref:TetR/AcrR family transcriptional regulator n=1 Tax=Verrucomicrobium sp. BvORR106 TaxID=1403819 RepID=UPI00056E07E2|nr:TetR/AcrR family transcriptional regulator [Verrucomicrobium sp. BvORR106]
MPRPKLHTDEAILDATRVVLKRRGPSSLTLNDVAKEVGISRAALIQRFENRDTLLRCALERSVKVTKEFFEKLPVITGPQGLWIFIQELCKIFGPGDSYEVHLQIAWHEAQDPLLRELAQRRNAYVEAEIQARFPKGLPDESKAASRLLQAMLAGATMQWLLNREGRLDAYVLESLRQTLVLLFPKEIFSPGLPSH